jgi:hypothetical protein
MVVMLSVSCCARAGAPARHSTEETRPATINPQARKTPRRARLPLAIARCLCFLTPSLTLETATPCRDDCQYCELMVSTATVCNIEPVRVNRNYDCQTFACPDTQETIAKTIYGSASRSKRRRAGGHGSESRLTKHIGCLRNLSSWLKLESARSDGEHFFPSETVLGGFTRPQKGERFVFWLRR